MKKISFLLAALAVTSSCQKKTNHEEKSVDNTSLFRLVTEGRIATDGGLSRGVAWGDYDNDGDADLYVANSNGQWNALYRNDGKGTFKKITADAIKASETVVHGGNSQGVNWVDYDNDYDLDLYVVSRGDEPNLLFRNDSTLGFKRIKDNALVLEGISASVACWADYDNDGDLDVFLAGYSNENILFNNKGGGFFERLETTLVTENKEGRARACACGDANDDGRPDLYIANARKVNQLFINKGNWNFVEVKNDHENENIGYSYGASWADYDNDGDLDLFVANFDRENFLYNNNGEGVFKPVLEGALALEKGGASKGHSWGDYDNDGDLDLFIANGTYAPDMRNFLFMNNGNGTFDKDTSEIMQKYADTSAGAAHSDYDLDGDLDVFVANWGGRDQVNRLYENMNETGNWLALKLKGYKSNSLGIGSKIALHVSNSQNEEKAVLYRWQYPITGYASQNDYEIHFGLNEYNRIDSLIIDWPSSGQETILHLEVNNRFQVEENVFVRD